MEITQNSLLEELIMAPMIETHFPNEFFPNTWSLSTPFDHQISDFHLPNPSFLELISPSEFNSPFGDFHPFLEDNLALPLAIEENVENREMGFFDINGFEDMMSSYNNKVEIAENNNIPNMDIIYNHNVDSYVEKKSKTKRQHGQPSKNLMAERRRRKRLNDRLSMLRSIVPKISKMDRTSILGDTIDYMRELLDKLREEGIENCLKEVKPNEMLVRNPSKFDVERRNEDTRVEICCTAKPGLLLSTLSTLELLGLDIHQCVISCFNDFSLQASCFEVSEHRSLLSSEDVKQALFRNAGYGGRCL